MDAPQSSGDLIHDQNWIDQTRAASFTEQFATGCKISSLRAKSRRAEEMTADEFATLVRSGHGKLRVTKVLLNAEGRKVRGHGLLEITPTQLELRLEVN